MIDTSNIFKEFSESDISEVTLETENAYGWISPDLRTEQDRLRKFGLRPFRPRFNPSDPIPQLQPGDVAARYFFKVYDRTEEGGIQLSDEAKYPQFTVTYGHKDGLGSPPSSNLPTQAIHEQYVGSLLPKEEEDFGFERNHFYAVNFNRRTFHERVREGHWELTLAFEGEAAQNGVRLVDRAVGDPTLAEKQEIEVVPGSVSGGINQSPLSDKIYGYLYSRKGIIVLNPDALADHANELINQNSGNEGMLENITPEVRNPSDIIGAGSAQITGLAVGTRDVNANNGQIGRVDPDSGATDYRSVESDEEIQDVIGVNGFLFAAENESGGIFISKFDIGDGSKISEITPPGNGINELEPADDGSGFYAMIDDPISDHSIRKYDLDLNELWSIKFPNDPNIQISNPEGEKMFAKGPNLYVASDTFFVFGDQAHVFKIIDNGNSATEAWRNKDPGSAQQGEVGAGITATDDFVFVGIGDNQILKLDESDGSFISEFQLRTNNIDRRPRDLEIGPNGNLFIGHGQEGIVGGPSRDGLITEAKTDFSQPTIIVQQKEVFDDAINHIEIADNGNIFAGSDDGLVRAFDPSLTQIWENADFDDSTPTLEITSLHLFTFTGGQSGPYEVEQQTINSGQTTVYNYTGGFDDASQAAQTYPDWPFVRNHSNLFDAIERGESFRLQVQREVVDVVYTAILDQTEGNFSFNPTYSDDNGDITFPNAPGTFPTTVGLYNDDFQLLATAKLSPPKEKDDESGLAVDVRLNF